MADKQKQKKEDYDNKRYHGIFCLCLHESSIIYILEKKKSETQQDTKFVVFALIHLIARFCPLIKLLTFSEEKKARYDERAAWQFFEQSLIEPLNDDTPLPPALAAHNAAYAALTA